ncbi:MAG: nucleoside kinase [Clostridia bacterium]|nr:nucleoside kinase [Clostridia bacterium]
MKIEYNGKLLEIEKGTKVIDIFKNEIEQSDRDIIGCRFNNEVKSLDYEINKDGVIELIDGTNKDGKRIYTRGLAYIMSKAFAELYKEALITVNYQISNSILCEIDNMEITDEMVENVKKRMQEIVDKDLKITKVMMSKEDAEVFYKKEKTLRGRLQLDNEEKPEVMLYYCEDYYNYFYGVMPISTGYIKIFDILKYGRGIILRYPSRQNPHKLGPFVEKPKMLKTLDEYADLHRVLDVSTVYKLNKKVKDDEIKTTILVDEALHEKKIANIADDIVSRKNVKVILIAGPSSSGKTTFAQRLGIQLRVNGIKPFTLSVDNYFVEREQTPRDKNGKYDFESINAIDLELFNSNLKGLINGEEVELPTFDFITGSKKFNGNKKRMKSDEILVIEGIHCLNDKLTAYIPKEVKYKIYISALTVLNIDYFNRISTTDTRLIRRIVRDYNYRGYSALHTLEMWPSVTRGENANIFPFQETADAMFNTSLVYELGVLRNYAMPLLAEIDNTHREYSEAKRLYRMLRYFEPIDPKYIPNQSLLREFIGESIFGA